MLYDISKNILAAFEGFCFSVLEMALSGGKSDLEVIFRDCRVQQCIFLRNVFSVALSSSARALEVC